MKTEKPAVFRLERNRPPGRGRWPSLCGESSPIFGSLASSPSEDEEAKARPVAFWDETGMWFERVGLLLSGN